MKRNGEKKMVLQCKQMNRKNRNTEKMSKSFSGFEPRSLQSVELHQTGTNSCHERQLQDSSGLWKWPAGWKPNLLRLLLRRDDLVALLDLARPGLVRLALLVGVSGNLGLHLQLALSHFTTARLKINAAAKKSNFEALRHQVKSRGFSTQGK